MVARGGRLSFSAGRSWRVAEGVGRLSRVVVRPWGGGGRLRVGVPAGGRRARCARFEVFSMLL